MMYLGGKSRVAKNLVPLMLYGRGDRQTYIEPFLGGGSVAARMAPHFRNLVLSDMSTDLIMLWKALQDGWRPPLTLTPEEWAELKHSPPSALRAFAGFGCSFGGSWFKAYAHPSSGGDHVSESARALVKKAHRLKDAQFLNLDYRGITPHVTADAVVYCDPPYRGTAQYDATPTFRHDAFYRTATRWANTGALVFVSEYSAPEPWREIWRKEVQATLSGAEEGKTVTERLYALPSTIERAGLQGFARRYM